MGYFDTLRAKLAQLKAAKPDQAASFETYVRNAEIAAGGKADPITLTGDRTITADDDGAVFACSTALTLTIPAGLSPRPSFVADPPPTGNLSIAVSGATTINGATTTLTRTRASNPAGVGVLAHQDSDSYGVSGS